MSQLRKAVAQAPTSQSPKQASTPLSTPSPTKKQYTIQQLQIDDVSGSLFEIAPRYYYTVKVDDGALLTGRTVGMHDKVLLWKKPEDSLDFEALDDSSFTLTLWKRLFLPHAGSQEIGSLRTTIRELFASLLGTTAPLTITPNVSAKHKVTSVISLVINEKEERRQAEVGMDGQVIETQDAAARMQTLDKAYKAEVAAVRVLSTVVYKPDDVPNTSEALRRLLDTVSAFVKLMDGLSNIHPYAQIACGALSAAHKIYQAQTTRDEKVNDLVEKMTVVYEAVLDSEALRPLYLSQGFHTAEVINAAGRHDGVLKRLSIQTTECARFIVTYAKDRSFLKRLGKNLLSNPDETIADLDNAFDTLLKEFCGQLQVHTEIIVVRLRQFVQNIAIDLKLQGLPHVSGASYSMQKQCLPNTRTSVLKELSDWISNLDDNCPQVCLLLGQAGTGKSTIAHTLAYRFDSSNSLGSAFCFTATSNVQALFPTIAIDLADFDPAFKVALWEGVCQKSAHRTTTDLSLQLRKYLLEPCERVAFTDSVLIVIDGLDEIRDTDARKVLFPILSQELQKLPPGFRVLLTARPEQDIIDHFRQAGPRILIRNMPTADKDSTLQTDIESFIRTELANIHGLDQSCYSTLARMSEGLFQWASVACKHVTGDWKWRGASNTPKKRYQALKKTAQSRGKGVNLLDSLYEHVLPLLVDLDSDESKRDFNVAMSLVLYAFEPLTVRAVRALSKHVTGVTAEDDDETDDDDDHILFHLGSFLSGISENNAPVRPLHSSFRDFLTQRRNSSDKFYIGDALLCHASLTTSCLRVLNTELHFNMCDLKTSYQLNRDVPELKERVEKCISPQLHYASRYWAYHLHSGWEVLPSVGAVVPGKKDLFYSEIVKLLEKKFLSWLEVLSLLGSVNTAAPSLSYAISWLVTHYPLAVDLATDGLQFVRNLSPPLCQSTPHIYLSALMGAPTTSLIKKHYSGSYAQVPQVCAGGREQWSELHHVLRGHNNSVIAIAFSPDGKRIVSGSWDNTVRIWDAETGEPSRAPLEGHDGDVWTVVFSPDGKWIMSGSGDKTIRIWDAETGELAQAPLEGHGGSVLSVAFSPDGKRIVSGSDDKTIRIWDAETGKPAQAPLEGHGGDVWTVVFSPDGKQIMSGSGDKTIRIWDTETGKPARAPLEGHGGSVWSVAFSPDGKQIVSGSDDKTIQIWDAKTGEPARVPLEGHSGGIWSVAFSPDGKRIVSGSWDKTIRIWDAKTGKPARAPLEGHGASVRSVAFSPDGKRIMSGSWDRTIRIWDAEMGEPAQAPLGGHSGRVWSVVFSPDGKRIMSGSDDNTIRIWDAKTGEPVLVPLEGHSGSIWSVAFSPNGKQIVSGSDDKTIRTWDAETGEPAQAPLEGHGGSVLCVAFSPDGKRIVSGSWDKTIRIWDAKTGEPAQAPLEGHSDSVWSVSFSPDGKQIVSGSADKTIFIWDAEMGKPARAPLVGHGDSVLSVAFSPNGKRLVSGSGDGTIQIWDAETGEPVRAPLEGHGGGVWSVVFSPDGKRIGSGSWDRTIRIWDAETGEPARAPLEGHGGSVWSVAFSPNGKRIVSGSADETIRIWDAETGQPARGPLEGHSDSVWSVTFSPDSKQIVSGSGDNTIRIWTADPPTEDIFCCDMNHFPFQPYISAEHHPAQVSFNSKTGWITCNKTDYLLWIPREYRLYLCTSGCRMVIPHMVTLDLSRFVHGSRWHECHQPAADSLSRLPAISHRLGT